MKTSQSNERIEFDNIDQEVEDIIESMEKSENQPHSYEYLIKLKKDILNLSKNLSLKEVRYLVDVYYQTQKVRVQLGNQIKAYEKGDEPCELIQFIHTELFTIESQIKKIMKVFTDKDVLANKIKQIKGIGEIISAGLIAHIDIKKAPHAGHIISFAGLAANKKPWLKGKKRPWNARLKKICGRIGQSFAFVCNTNSTFGRIYKERKQLEELWNSQLKFKEQAEYKLEHFNIDKTTEAYKWYTRGMLPPAQIGQRARNYATRKFLHYYFWVAYKLEHGVEPPLPYPIAILGHTTLINWIDVV